MTCWCKNQTYFFGGGWPPKGGGGDFGRSGTTFSAPKAPKKSNFWKFLGKNYVQWPIFGAAGAENFDKSQYLSEKSPNFDKFEDFIA